MLRISEKQTSAFKARRLEGLSGRIDVWLGGEIAGWNQRPPEARGSVLREMVKVADSAGMEAETDYALMVWIFLNIKGDWRAFASSKSATNILQGDAKPATRLIALRNLAQGGTGLV